MLMGQTFTPKMGDTVVKNNIIKVLVVALN